MKIVPIFADPNPSLYSIRFSEEDLDEFERLFDLWSDYTYLENFFEENKSDLQSGFFDDYSIEDAIKKTVKEANELKFKLLELSQKGQTDRNQALCTLFKPLNNNEYKLSRLQKQKGILKKQCWLRIYAIKIAPNLFVVSGGAIKLTKLMEEKSHLKEELIKLERTKNFLSENGLLDEENFEYLEI